MIDPPSDPLKRALEDALALLEAHGDLGGGPVAASAPLPSLLEQCETIYADLDGCAVPAVRSLHHFACTGGTLISKCLAALPGSVLLSEIDPLSTLHLGRGQKLFFPTDILADLHIGVRRPTAEDLCDIFMAGILRMRDRLAESGQTLIVRDHAHSQFCTDVDPAGRPTVHDILAKRAPVRALLTLRHPLDSFLALQANKWDHFAPFTLEEYCLRYRVFLAAHDGIARISYEAFVAEPEKVLQQMCDILDLPFNPLALDLIDLFRLSGDSGRSSGQIVPRPRRAVPKELALQADQGPTYGKLCAELGYNPDPAADPALIHDTI